MKLTPENINAKSWNLHYLAIEKLKKHPELLMDVKNRLERWKSTISPSCLPLLLQWEIILNHDLDFICEKTLEKSEIGNDLRSSSPLVCILGNKERFDFLKEWKNRET